MFVDQVKVILRAGRGGNGCLSFRREKNVPRGGPDGGRGGDGGSIYLTADENISSLAYFRYHPINKAGRGAHGEGGNRQGKRGKELDLHVPVGTVIKGPSDKKIIFDFIKPGQKYLAAQGGRGGKGNASFATPTHQAPRIFEEGEPGEENEFVLELKLIADVGLIGFPNVGKSTLISKISAAKPVIADYPFTTLVPNLGVVDVDENNSFVVADIPGMIEGAHKGHGLGLQFLKHIERTKILVHILDVSPYTQRDPVRDYRTVREELAQFDPKLIKRRQILVANKIDLIPEEDERLRRVGQLAKKEKIPFFAVSAMKKEGLKPLVREMWESLQSVSHEAEMQMEQN